MRLALVAAVLVVGCRPMPAATVPAARPVLVPPRVPRAAYDVVPAELGDAGVLQRIEHRVRLRRLGTASLRADGPPLSRAPDGEVASVLPVIGETTRKIRVVTEDDHARLALWIDRADASRTVLAPVALADRDGHTPAEMGAWLEPGVALDVIERGAAWRHVEVRDEEVEVSGWLPPQVIGHVWVAPPSAAEIAGVPRETVWTPPRDARPRVTLTRGAVIRADADRHALALATTSAAGVTAALVARRGAWTEIELFRPQLRVRGLVETAAAADATDEVAMHGSGTGHGFGMSNADIVEVPAGACLFDGVDGDVIGVQLALGARYGTRRAHDVDGWTVVFVDTAWALLDLYVHDTGGDPTHPIWESCAR